MKQFIKLPLSLSKLLAGCFVFCFISTSQLSARDQFCPPLMGLANLSEDTVYKEAKLSAIRIVSNEKEVGSGFLFDAKSGLFLTAYHVVRDLNEIKVQIPSLFQSKEFDASLIDYIDASEDLIPEHAHDIAIMRIDNPPQYVSELEIPVLPLKESLRYYLIGFGGVGNQVSIGEVRAHHQSQCIYTYRGSTSNGDSGGAIVSRSGALNGIVIQKSVGGSQGVFVASACLKNELLASFEMSKNDESQYGYNKTISLLSNLNVYTPPALISPPNDRNNWLSNLDLLSFVREHNLRQKELPINDRHKCILQQEIGIRLGSEVVSNFIITEFAVRKFQKNNDTLKSKPINFEIFNFNEQIDISNKIYELYKNLYDNKVILLEEYLRGLVKANQYIEIAFNEAENTDPNKYNFGKTIKLELEKEIIFTESKITRKPLNNFNQIAQINQLVLLHNTNMERFQELESLTIQNSSLIDVAHKKMCELIKKVKSNDLYSAEGDFKCKE